MVLRCDITSPASYLDAGLVLTAMTELQLICISPCSQGKDLIAKANAKDGFIFLHQFPNQVYGLQTQFGISRPIRDYYSVELIFKKVIIPGDLEDRNVPVQQAAYDAVLTPTVNHNHL